MKFQAILFDLDGTLLDTLTDIANSMNATLARFGFPTYPNNAFRYFTGNGMDGLVRRALPDEHRDNQTLNKCLAFAKEQYRKRWPENTKPYPRIPELLDALEKLGLPKVVFSNKPDEFTKAITETLLSKWSFDIVRGARPSAPKKPDPAAALEIANELKIAPHHIIYLGDTNTDMRTANLAGMYPVGVLWGFRDKEELLAYGAKAIVKTPLEVLTLLK